MAMLAVSIFAGIWYWICKTDVGYAITHAIRQPLFAALPIGLMMGDVQQAMIIGAAVQILYIGLVAAGSNLPADDCLAGLIAIPIAIQSHLTPALAIAIAVPVGVMGVFVDQLRKTINVMFVHMADRYAEEGNTRKIVLASVVYPTALSFFFRFPIPFFAILYGADAVNSFMNSVPQWLVHGFSVAGGLLPALGFALTMFVIGKKELFPWFIIGYFLVQFSGIPIIGAAIFGLCAVLLITYYNNKKNMEA
ncbi:PTS mannose/fructose/sorbose/N-acetylgalactosamine transporter subunit IIC [Paenibacillus oralis]|nr:PTS sugar transporter subunit IIC [Paenibacillus oralis]